jgi:transcription-repair coupling factor (superfamily II helicase)
MTQQLNLPGASRAKYIIDSKKFSKIVIITNNNNEIDEVYNDILLFHKKEHVYRFYELNQAPFEQARVLTDILENRITTLDKIFNDDAFILITTFYGILKKFPNLKTFQENLLFLQKNRAIPRELLIHSLDVLDYINVEVVSDKGEYCVRGDICEIFPMGYENPLRVEFIDDTIVDISFYNIFNHRSIQKIDSINILPASEGLYSTENFVSSIKKYPKIYEKASIYGKFAGHHWFAPLLNNMISISELINGAYQVVVYNDLVNIDELYEKINDEKSLVEYPLQLTSIFIDKEELEKFINDGNPQLFNEITEPLNTKSSYAITSKVFIPDTINTYKNITNFISIVKKLIHEDFTIIIAIESKKFLELLMKFFEENELIYKNIDSLLDSQNKIINIYRNKITGGFIHYGEKLIIFGEKDIFGFNKISNRKKKKAALKTTLLDLEIGGYAVHVDYGVAIFKGLVHKTIGSIEADFLELQYDNNEILYVPVSAINQIQKYVGSTNISPKLSSLRSSSWGRIKRKAYHSARQVATDLLKLYGERKKEEGFAFKLDRLLLEKLENTFEYDETEDQLATLLDVYNDMGSRKPMERLICGDVGFGKTEIAIRAACVAVSNGKQVAVLTPTTVLTYQHYETFKRRFQDMPVNIDFLCRFKNRGEIKTTKSRIANGEIDIIIGTHMLLSKDVIYHDLGLLIIDEEQRFGVSQKEKIKAMKSNIDVLSISATPIPRTLQLSLSGLRDFSIIETPPAERQPIITKIISKEDEIIEALLNELKRGGQAYFIHNNIKSIEEVAYKLKEKLPFARITFAHAGMSSAILEKIFNDFYLGNIDILVCTTIIENGIDVPRANTMIVDNAGNFGLSQLYQLKGRVGRSNKRAYFYIYVDNLEGLPPLVKKRIQIIQRLSDLGSGFKIASYDLQLRGAGDILGAEQSGFITNIGYELYLQMIENAINEMSGFSPARNKTEILSYIPNFIPANYIEDYRVRLEYYKKIGEIYSFDAIFPIANELEMEFGTIPDVVKNYIYIMFIKNLAEKLLMKRIVFFNDSISITVANENKILHNLFNFYNNENIIIKSIKENEIKIYSKRELLADATVALSDIYNEYISIQVKHQEVL